MKVLDKNSLQVVNKSNPKLLGLPREINIYGEAVAAVGSRSMC